MSPHRAASNEEPITDPEVEAVEVPEAAAGFLFAFIPKPARPAARWFIGLCVFVGMGVSGFLWLDARVDAKIVRISVSAIESKASASESTVADMKIRVDDHERRIKANEDGQIKSNENTAAIQSDIRVIRQILDDRLPTNRNHAH